MRGVLLGGSYMELELMCCKYHLADRAWPFVYTRFVD